MKAINRSDHQLILNTLKQLNHVLDGDKTKDQSMEKLAELYLYYQRLISELSVCIAEYDTLYHHLRTKVLAPALKKSKRMSVETEQSKAHF